MINAVIIDDEEHARLTLSAKLGQYCPEVQVTGLAADADAGQELIEAHRPDLVFLDVAMPGDSGFDLLQRLESVDFEIIFVTGFDHYAIDAISVCAIGYLLKPIQQEALIQTVHRAVERIRQRQDHERNIRLLENLQQPGQQSNKIGIPVESGLVFIAVGEVVRCDAYQGVTKVVRLNKAPDLLSAYPIGEFVRLLEPYGFFLAHRSHLVNLSHIVQYSREGYVIMEDGAKVPVSKRKRSEFLQRLTRL
ncbi:LytR/AlgR family response regulator transcription factor [Phaeodactylibacter luteus]|nr:LytTR family DNA-binding domain-containing protein [Phaeodactylibacter luteus]